MAENIHNNNQGPEKKPDKNIKPRFNTNWIFAILAVSVILFQFIYSGKTVQKTTTSEIKEMIANHDIEKLVVVNKEQAEIYLKKEALNREDIRNCQNPEPDLVCQYQNQISHIILVISAVLNLYFGGSEECRIYQKRNLFILII